MGDYMDHIGYRPDHYREVVPDDRSRLGGTMGDQPDGSNYLVATHYDIAAVHVFSNTVIVIDNDGSVTVIDRHNGQLRTA